MITLNTGMRRGEVLGLRWWDINLSRQTVSVKQILITDGKQLIFTSPKTKRSNRTIDITDKLTEELKKHKAEQVKDRAAVSSAGGKYQDNDLVICEVDGSPIIPATFSGR